MRGAEVLDGAEALADGGLEVAEVLGQLELARGAEGGQEGGVAKEEHKAARGEALGLGPGEGDREKVKVKVKVRK